LNQASKKWGIEIQGSQQDQEAWSVFLKAPFNPYVEQVKDERGDYRALRATEFDKCSTPQDVHTVAQQLFSTLNVVMLNSADADRVEIGAVIEFVPGSRPRKHFHMHVEAGAIRVRGGIVTLIHTDAHGNVFEPTAVPSRAQRWMRAAALEPAIGSALRYMEGKPGWSELYKAYEPVRNMPRGHITKTEIKRFTQTANAGERHHPNDKNKPHERPMELWEARALITQWISASIDENLVKNP
jgi:hypothetical protein